MTIPEALDQNVRYVQRRGWSEDEYIELPERTLFGHACMMCRHMRGTGFMAKSVDEIDDRTDLWDEVEISD